MNFISKTTSALDADKATTDRRYAGISVRGRRAWKIRAPPTLSGESKSVPPSDPGFPKRYDVKAARYLSLRISKIKLCAARTECTVNSFR